jgi:hypothetical protein
MRLGWFGRLFRRWREARAAARWAATGRRAAWRALEDRDDDGKGNGWTDNTGNGD